jgi:predicted MPP superfamily phosphohydrolase
MIKLSSHTSGHTHGMQFELNPRIFFKWSLAQYVYKQWAGLYEKETGRYVYVQPRGWFHTITTRVNIVPEITVLTKKGSK